MVQVKLSKTITCPSLIFSYACQFVIFIYVNVHVHFHFQLPVYVFLPYLYKSSLSVDAFAGQNRHFVHICTSNVDNSIKRLTYSSFENRYTKIKTNFKIFNPITIIIEVALLGDIRNIKCIIDVKSQYRPKISHL
jgi:hypothetical protein